MTEKKRKTFTAKVGQEAIRGVKTGNELGQEYGVHPVQVGQWKKVILKQAGTLFEATRGRGKHAGVGIGWYRDTRPSPNSCSG